MAWGHNNMPDTLCAMIDEEDVEEFDPDWYEEFEEEEETEPDDSELTLDELIAKYAAEGDVGEEEIEYDTSYTVGMHMMLQLSMLDNKYADDFFEYFPIIS